MRQLIFLSTVLFFSWEAFAQNVGIGTSTPQARLHVADSNVLFNGDPSGQVTIDPSPLPASGPGIRMMWIPRKAAFRVGAATSNEWDKHNIGHYSFASGWGSIASGFASTALGSGMAAGEFAVSLGSNADAIGYTSTAIGGSSNANGNYSTSIGFSTNANGFSSLAIGIYNDSIVHRDGDITNTTPLFIIGNGNSNNNRSNAMVVLKNGNTGIGTNSPQARLHVADSGVVFTAPTILPTVPGPPPVSGYGSRMMWYPDKAAFRVGSVSGVHWDEQYVGTQSAAFGYSNKAEGYASFAAGTNSTAPGSQSMAVGAYAHAAGSISSAFGSHTTAAGTVSTSFGVYNTANGWGSLVAGVFNDPILASPQTVFTSTTPLFIIGNGDDVANRSNAVVVLKNGNVGIGNNDNPVNRLHITGGALADLTANSGFMTIGNIAGTNMVFDQNEIQVRGNNALPAHLYLQKNGGNVMIGDPANGNPPVVIGPTHTLSVNGSASKTGSTAWSSWSDVRLKQNIEPYTDGLSSLLKIKPVWYQYNAASGFDAETRFVGVLAQQLQQVSPYMVTETSSNKTSNGSGYLSVDNGAMTYMLINAVKEQQQQIEELKQIVKQLSKK